MTDSRQFLRLFESFTDEDYFAAIQRKDIPALQKMVEAAAASRGYNIKAFHGTGEKKFTRFKAQLGRAIWFADNPDVIRKGESGAARVDRIVEVYLNAQRPAGWSEYHKLMEIQIIEQGFDSLRLDHNWVVFDPSQIKSAELVTKSGGKVIPLSRRFDAGINDIRY